MTNSNDRMDRFEAGLEELRQITRSNAKAIEALTADLAADRENIAATSAAVDGLAQLVTEFSIRSEARLNSSEARLNRLEDMAVRSEARLNRLDDVVVGIERILERLTRRDQNGNDDQPQR